MRRNTTAAAPKTYEGGAAGLQNPLEELQRTVSTCLLWEETFYESGSEIAKRISALCDLVPVEEIGKLAITARTDLKLRHVPLLLCCEMARKREHTALVGQTIAAVCRRPDEMAELIAIYWRDGKRPLPKQFKLGLASAFTRFTEYQLAKWDRQGPIRLRDVLFMCHAKPGDDEQAALWKRLIDGTLKAADTWEVALSGGADKKATWERLLSEGQLGYMALLMNLRNMDEAGVDRSLVENAISAGAKNSKALPFRFISAAKAAPTFAGALSDAMCAAITDRLPGRTALVLDVSGSMAMATISRRSQLMRWEAGAALGVLLREMCESCDVWTFSAELVECPGYRGLGLVDAVRNSQMFMGTYLSAALTGIKAKRPVDRVIVVTDEQSHDGIITAWTDKAYLVNVAPYKPGLDTHRGWTRISGWSERIVEWIKTQEV